MIPIASPSRKHLILAESAVSDTEPSWGRTIRVRIAHPFLLDVGLTTLTGVLVLISGLFVVSLVGRRMGALAVGEYLLLRRVATWLSSGIQLGLGVALPRYVALSVDEHQADQLEYLFGALLCIMGVATTFGVLLLTEKVFFAQWLFGSPGTVNLVLPLTLVLLGQAAHTAVYGFYRGKLSMHWANALQIANIVLVPVVSIILFYRTRSIAFVLSFNGIAIFAISLLFLLPSLHRLRPEAPSRIVQRLRELLRYGVARVPGDFAGNALFAIGPIVATHYLPLSEVSHLLLGLGLLMAISLSVTPCSTVLLSKISMMIARDQLQEVRSRLEQFIVGILELSVFGCLQAMVFADVIVRVWVGKDYLRGLDVIHLTLLSVPFLLIFVAIRSAIDAATVIAHNAINGSIALVVFLLLSGLVVKFAPVSYLLDGLSSALLVANAVLAWRTTQVAIRLFRLHIPWQQSILPVVTAFLLGGLSYAIHQGPRSPIGLVGILLVELVMTILFLGLSARVGSTWMKYFWQLFDVNREYKSVA